MSVEGRTAERVAGLTALAVRHPGRTSVLALVSTAALFAASAGLSREVGYAAYFGPDDPHVARLDAFLSEFDSGLHVLVVFGCRESPRCRRADEPWALEFTGRLHAGLDALPNVRRTWSALNAPIALSPLVAGTVGERGGDGTWRLVPGWNERLEAARRQRAFAGRFLSDDGRSGGLVVELRSLRSAPMRETVGALHALLPDFERELGAELHLAGDPVWTVASATSLERDSTVLTALMFAVMALVLLLRFRDGWLTLLPLVSVAAVAVGVRGSAALLGMPYTSILGALPPLLVTLAVAGSIHLLAAFARRGGPPGTALVEAAREVGPGCFWGAATTAAGFASFGWSDLSCFRDFGLLAALGVALAFAVTFGLLPALVFLSAGRASGRGRSGATSLSGELLEASFGTVARYPRFVVFAALGALLLLAAGGVRLRTATDFGFGDRSRVVRSLRVIETSFRKPMTTEVVVTLPPGVRGYDPEPLRVLHRVEGLLEAEPSSGRAWSLLDLLEDAFRIDRARAPGSFEELAGSGPRGAPLVAAFEHARSFWSEATAGGAPSDRLRVSAERAWLDDAAQGPYVRRLRAALAELEAELSPRGYRLGLEGGLPLADRFVEQLRETQLRSFASAFAWVGLALAWLLRDRRVVAWALVANALPVLALLGLMGWSGIGVDPANAMVGAILLAVAVDDTVHLGLRHRAAVLTGRSPRAAVEEAFRRVGEPVLTTSVCLALGFSVLLFSEWGGLASFGLLAGLGVGLVLAGDLLLLPAALLASERSGAADAAD